MPDLVTRDEELDVFGRRGAAEQHHPLRRCLKIR
jgi:hypothetical protein